MEIKKLALPLFFKDAKDVFEKMHRDTQRIEKEVSSDAFWDFALTAWHLFYWVQRGDYPAPVKVELDASLRNETAMQVCRDIANASKHFQLTYVPKTKEVQSKQGWGVGRFGKGGFGIGEEEIMITLNDDRKLDVFELVDTVYKLWEDFLKKHGIIT